MRPRVVGGVGGCDTLSGVSGEIAENIHNPRGKRYEASRLRRFLPSQYVGRRQKRFQGRSSWAPPASLLSRLGRGTVASLSKALVVAGVGSVFPLNVSTRLALSPDGDAGNQTEVDFPKMGIAVSGSGNSFEPKEKKPSSTVYHFPRCKTYGAETAVAEAKVAVPAFDGHSSGKAKVHIHGTLHSLVPVSSRPHLAKLPARFEVAIEDDRGRRQNVSFKRDILVKKNDIVAPLKNEDLKTKETAAQRLTPVLSTVPRVPQAKPLASQSRLSDASSVAFKRERHFARSDDAALWKPPEREGSDNGLSLSTRNQDATVEEQKARAEPPPSPVLSKDSIDAQIPRPTRSNIPTQMASAAKLPEVISTVAQPVLAVETLPSEKTQQAPTYYAVPVPGIYGHLYPVEDAVYNAPQDWNPTQPNNTQALSDGTPIPAWSSPPSTSVLPWQILTVLLGGVSGLSLVAYLILGCPVAKRNSGDQLLPNLLLCCHGIHACDCRECSACAKNDVCTCPCHPSIVAVDGFSAPPVMREVYFELVPK